MARIARDEMHGASLDEALTAILRRHEHAQMVASEVRAMAADNERGEVDEWDAVAGDGIA